MADRLQNPNFLLQAFRARLLAVPTSPLESFHSVLYSGRPLYAQVDRSKVAFAQLLQNLVLLFEGAAFPALRVVEVEAGLVKYRYLVRVFELSSLVPADDCFIYKCAIA